MVQRIAANSFFSCCCKLIEKEEAKFKNDTDKDTPLQYTKVPLEKIFQFAQPQLAMSLHPQIKKTSVISNQPTRFMMPGIVSPTPTKTLRRMPTYEESCFRSRSLLFEKETVMSSNLPVIDFILFYDVQTYALTVNLLYGSCLSQTTTSTVNAFVTVILLPHKEQKFQSRTVHKDLNPVFNETYVFDNISFEEIHNRTLVLRVFNHEKFSCTLIGIAILPLNKAELHGVGVSVVLNKTDDLETSNSTGDIQLSLRYNPSANVISGLLIKAINLRKMDVFGLSDPYIVIKLIYKGETITKWRSKIIWNTLSPTFNQDFTLDLADVEIDKVTLRLTMKDKDVLSRDDLMGVMEFGNNVKHATGCTHWKETIGNPFTRVTHWHCLVPAHR